MHDYIELRWNIWKIHSLVQIHTTASIRYCIKKQNKTQQCLAGVLCLTQSPVPEGVREDRDCDPMVGLNKMKDKCVARNYGSPSIPWSGKLSKGGSYPSLLWCALKTALRYLNWTGGQNCRCRIAGWQMATALNRIWSLYFWSVLLWLQLLSLSFTLAPELVLLVTLNISHLLST